MSSSLERMQTSTPIQDSPNRLRAQIHEMQKNLSKLALENEELKYELTQTRLDFEELSLENQRLCQAIQEKETIQTKMGEQLNMVTETAYAIYEKFTAFKRRYYEGQQNAWLQCADAEK